MDPSATSEAALTRPVVRRRSYHRLYASHLLAQFGDRLWQFAVPILFSSIWTDTLLPSAFFSFFLYIVKLLCVPAIGRCVDTTDRLRLIVRSTFGQMMCMFMSALLLVGLAKSVEASGARFGENGLDLMLLVALIAVGIVGDLFNVAGKLGIEKDWVVVIAGGDRALLAKLNANLRRIDLLCKIAAPFLFGILINLETGRQEQVVLGTSLVMGWNLLAVFPIYHAWSSVYFQYADLQTVRPAKRNNPLRVFAQGCKAYVRLPAFGASLAYCFLYFTVLSDHHPLSTAFLRIDGVSAAVLGVARGGGALMGLLGTVLFTFLRTQLGLIPASLVSAWAFAGCIVPISLLYIDSAEYWPLRSYLLLGAIVVSRVFLWCFDLSNVQMMQETVAEDSRGELNGMQAATCQVMELVMSFLSLFCTAPGQFRFLVFASAAGVSMAAVLLSLWATCRR